MPANHQAHPVFLPQILQQRAGDFADNWSFTFLDSRGDEQCLWRSTDLAAGARAIAARLERETRPGEPVLLVFPAGAEFFAAFLGCLWSGRLATPINPPRRNRLIERLVAVATDSNAKVALTSAGLLESIDEWCRASTVLGALSWFSTEDLPDAPDLDPAATVAEDIAFLQYTSGSTALPKGVKVSHGNLIQDLARMEAVWSLNSDSTMISWLPAFHDLGLIFGLLQPLFSGCASVQMAPNAFLQKPALWLQAITRYHGTHSAAPSFAYDLCCRRIATHERTDLDLGSWAMAMNAAEPINPAVMEQFIEQYRAYGFRRDSFAPAYGLAESTLAVTASPVGEPPVVRHFDADALAADRAAISDEPSMHGRAIPGSGRPLPDVPIAIVDPETRRRCQPDQIGEIWVGGPTIASGYWQRAEETDATFGAVIEGEARTEPYLRTGDLGVVADGELFVTGRLKDLIILGGNNFYPHDIEWEAQNAHDALRRDNGAAFSVAPDGIEGGREQVVLVQELERTRRRDDPEPIFRAIVDAVWRNLEVALSRIVLIAPGAVLRTSSGKIQRRANRTAYLDDALPVIAQWEGQSAAERASVHEAPPVQADALVTWLTGWLADRLGLPARAITPEQGFAEMGLDSIGSTELAFALGEKLGAEQPETIAFDYPTIARLVAHAAPASEPQNAASVRSAAPVVPSSPGNDLDDLLTSIERDDK